MNMPDKDIDQLFQSKLDGFEVEPSAKVWQGIAGTLPTNKRKNYTAWLSIAASVIVLVTAGLLFLPEKPVKNSAGDTKVIKSNAAGKLANAAKEPVINRNTGDDVIKTDVRIAVNPDKKHHIPSIKNNRSTQVVNQPAKTDAVTTVNKPGQMIASVETKPLQQAVVPDAPLAAETDKTATDETLTPVSLAVNNDVQEHPKKHKVRGLGGLINMVVASVDKRQDKIIEFSDTDEGDSITGINLGFIKVKKDK